MISVSEGKETAREAVSEASGIRENILDQDVITVTTVRAPPLSYVSNELMK
jgi:hypothetical protein